MKKQIIIIGGGTTFDTYEEFFSYLKKYKFYLERLRSWDWKFGLGGVLGKNYDVLIPKMPNPSNAKYEEWKVIFKRLSLVLDDEVILIGHSLGGIFLAKFLSENKFKKKIKATFLVSAPFGSGDLEESLGDFVLPKSLKKFENQCDKIFLFQSKDDFVVPFKNVLKYKESLPNAKMIILEDRGHFNQEEFTELAREIKKLK